MDVLRVFHVMNLQARLAPTDFYRALERLTDGQGLTELPVRTTVCISRPSQLTLIQDQLAQFMVMVREWRHIKMSKRAGRAHALTGISGTEQGELSIPCRSCPHPGVNLPDGWREAPPNERWVAGNICSLLSDKNPFAAGYIPK